MYIEQFLPHIALQCIVLHIQGAISPVLKQFRFAAGLKVGHHSSKLLQPLISESNFQQVMSPHDTLNT